MTDLNGKVAIVTGAARGIGAELAQALAAAGARVVVADVLDGSSVAARIGAAGGEAMYCRADVTSAASVAALVADTLTRFGTIDVLVNNAGIFADLAKKPFTEIDDAEWDRVMAVNVRGSFACAKAIAPVMIAKGGGKIVNIASGTP
jgi:NAD(P)-dependent dehydrogenase (short-subunit alcohol dehydrogenase family)